MLLLKEEPSEQIMLPLEKAVMNSGYIHVPVSELPESPCTLSGCMDVNIVPEHNKEQLELAVEGLQGEIFALRSSQIHFEQKRREALNRVLDIKGCIRVFCRLRSGLLVDNCRARQHMSVESDKITVRSVGTKKEFNVDRVFTQNATQEEVSVEVQPILRSALDGHNVCILAYGQTGTGKTYTMEGSNDQPGIVPRAIEEMFSQSSCDKLAAFTFSISMLEVYMGSIRDLLAPKKSLVRPMEHSAKCGLSILTDSKGSVEVEGLTDIAITDYKQGRRWYAKGKRVRSTSWTNVNEASSRSHCLTRITITRSGDDPSGDRQTSKLWMVDLGGSERLLKTGATGQTMDEGKAINLSLSALGDVIAALKRKHSHIPYRNSKLTQILSDSLGNGSKVLMVVHISPHEDDIGETICSLNFARRMRAIEYSRELSEEMKKQKEKCITDLTEQINDAEVELQKIRNQIERAENLIQEKQQLFPVPFHKLLEDHKGSPRSPFIIDQNGILGSPRTTEKASCNPRSNPLPHFMIPTACSRRRHGASGEMHQKLRPSRMDLLGSQSLSYSDSHIKSNSRHLKKKTVTPETPKTRLRDVSSISNSSVSKPSTAVWSRKVSTSQPNTRTMSYQHRRRMSDLT